MCDPVTITAIAGLATRGAGTFIETQAAQQNYKFQEQVAKNNAVLARSQADRAMVEAGERGGQQAISASREAMRLRGQQVNTMASNGVDLNFGSALSTLEDTDYLSEMDANTIRSNAMREGALQAWGYQSEAVNYENSANMYRAAARNSNPFVATGLSLISGGTQFAAAGTSGGL